MTKKKKPAKAAKKPAKPAPKRGESSRTKAPTISDREETPRTKAPTDRHAGAAARTGRARSDTTFDGAPPAAMPRPSRTRNDTVIEPLVRVEVDELAAGDEPSDPSRALELAALDHRVAASDDPDLLVALASQIDTIGMQLAFEISRHVHDEAHIAPLKPVLMRVPTSYGRALIRAAEKFDDRGSPKRAAYVLFDALRKAFDADLIVSVSEALSFTLEAHGQNDPARRLRELVALRAAQKAAGVDRKEIRTQFGTAIAELRDRAIDWTALADDPPQFD